MSDPLLDAEAEARALVDAAGQLETLAQERDTARELCRDAIQARDKALAEVERLRKYEPRVVEVHATPGEATARVRAPFAQDFALLMAELLVEHDAPNYIETKVEHPTVGTIAVTVQRCAGKTPHQFRLEAQAQAAALGEQLVEAMDTIQVFHGRVGWKLYRDHSPEMDRWRTTLRAAGVRVPPHLMPGGVE